MQKLFADITPDNVLQLVKFHTHLF